MVLFFGDAILKEVGKVCLKYLRAIAFVLTATSLSFLSINQTKAEFEQALKTF